jgi:hypothetical protein
MAPVSFCCSNSIFQVAVGRSYDALWKAVGAACDPFTEQECENFFTAAGYESD